MERLGMKVPIISAPMGPFYTTDLTIAVSEAGGLGVLSTRTSRARIAQGNAKQHAQGRRAHGQAFWLQYSYRADATRCGYALPSHPAVYHGKPEAARAMRLRAHQRGKSNHAPRDSHVEETQGGEPQHHALPRRACQVARGEMRLAGCRRARALGNGRWWPPVVREDFDARAPSRSQKAWPDVPKVACGGFATGESLAAALALGAGAIAMARGSSRQRNQSSTRTTRRSSLLQRTPTRACTRASSARSACGTMNMRDPILSWKTRKRS